MKRTEELLQEAEELKERKEAKHICKCSFNEFISKVENNPELFSTKEIVNWVNRLDMVLHKKKS